MVPPHVMVPPPLGRHHKSRVPIQATPIKILTEIPFQQCAFLKSDFNRLGSRRSHTSALDDRDLDNATTVKKRKTKHSKQTAHMARDG